MLSWLFRNKVSDVGVSHTTEKEVFVQEGFTAPLPVDELLALPRRQKFLMHIWQRTSISRKQFDLLYLKPIERYAALVQLFPASEAHHHAYPGGMLDHGLEIMAYALKLRQSHLLHIGSSPEEQSAQSEVWSAGIAYAALLHDIGKIAVDLHVEYENGQIWHPWHGAVTKPYRFKYRKDREYRLHSASAGLLYHQILDNSILDWLSQTPELWSALLYVLAGQSEHAGILGEIVTKADQASVAQELGGDPAKAMQAPKHALQRKLLDGLRYLIKEQLKLNNAGPGDGWLTDDALWLVSKTVSDKLRAHLLSQGVSGIPDKNSAIFDVLQEHGIILATSDNKAIWSATVNSGSGWSTSFTFMKVAPAIIWETDERPMSFTGTVTINATSDLAATADQQEVITATATPTAQAVQPVQAVPPAIALTEPTSADSLDAVFDILGLDTPPVIVAEDQTVMEPVKPTPIAKPVKVNTVTNVNKVTTIKPIIANQVDKPAISNNGFVQPSGEHFIEWLKDAILNKKLIINDAHALVHTVADTIYIVTPGIFNRYAQEFPAVEKFAKEEDVQPFRWIQKRFEKIGVHKKQPEGLNIWTCEVKGPRKTKVLHGYLLTDPTIIIPEIPFNNPYLTIKNN